MSRIVLFVGAATLAALVPAGLGLAANPSLSMSTPVAPSLVRSTLDPSTGEVVLNHRSATVEAGDDRSSGAVPRVTGDDHGGGEPGDDKGGRGAEPGDDHGGHGSGHGGHGSDDSSDHD